LSGPSKALRPNWKRALLLETCEADRKGRLHLIVAYGVWLKGIGTNRNCSDPKLEDGNFKPKGE
jgi:hypothetical protein